MWTLLFAVVVSGCCLPGASRVVCADRCESEGECSVRTFAAGDAGYRCLAGSDSECAGSEACAKSGRCWATEQGGCVVQADVPLHECRRSRECSLRGRCGSLQGACRAVADADCAASFECRTQGRCAARGGVCIPATAADLRAPVASMPREVPAPVDPTLRPLEPPAPVGPGSVAYDLTLDGARYEGILAHASVLTGLKGFAEEPVDLLVLRAEPGDTCRPKSKGMLPLDAVWLLAPLPPAAGEHALRPGPLPGEAAAKTWTWDGKVGRSHNFGLDGGLRITRPLADGRLEGTLDLVARPYFESTSIGTLRGTFSAAPIDCSSWTGGFPL